MILGIGSLTITSCGGDSSDGGSVEPPAELVRVSITGTSVLEGDDIGVTVSAEANLNTASTQTVTVAYSTVNGSAFSGTDYDAVSGILTFAPGETQKTIETTVMADVLKEGDEIFKIVLSEPTNAEVFGGTAEMKIRNDDDGTLTPQAEDGFTSASSYEGYSLVWEDDFSGTELNTADWTYELGNGDGGWGNNELQNYTDQPENVKLEDGKLIITATDAGNRFTSARIKTQEKKTFQFGRIDIRAKLPEGQGIWPALWMLGTDITSIGWPKCGEIDIMELVGHKPSVTHATVHYGPEFPNNKFTGTSYVLQEGKFSDSFHVFSVAWYMDEMYFFVDDVFFYKVDPSTLGGESYLFNKEFFFIFNVAVGGNWPGVPDENTTFPQTMVVDYLRVFQEN